MRPRAGTQCRQLILVSSLTGKWACWACSTGWLLLQWGSLPHSSHVCIPPSPVSSFLCNFPFSHPPPALSHPRFPLPLSILSSHLSLQCPTPKILPQRCSHPNARVRLVPAHHTRLPKSAHQPLQGGSHWDLGILCCSLSHRPHGFPGKKTKPRRVKPQGHLQSPDPCCCSPALGDTRLVGQRRSAAWAGQPSNAAQGCVIPGVTSPKRANAASRTADGKSYSREGKRGAHQHPQLSP